MKVIPPIAITEAMITSSTAVEPGSGETAWAAGTSYTVGTTVIRTTTQGKYTNLIAGVDATLPENALTGVTPRWLYAGPTNRHAMFTTDRNVATVVNSPLAVAVTPGQRVNSLALMGLVADSATVSVTVSGVEVFTRTENLITRATTTWSTYMFGTFGNRQSLVMFDLPPVSGAVITVTLTRASGQVSCSAMVIGNAIYIGATQYNAVSGALNFSTITRDTFGRAVLLARRSVPKTDQTLRVAKPLVNSLIDVRTKLNAVPAVWSGLDDLSSDDYFEAVLILGIYKDFSISLTYPDEATVTLQLEEI
jgi:hypothetical protein